MRIIYKIKSSWDFISSQILIYLKRRWNSKMAISIKNHEDRITALEKVNVSTLTLLWVGDSTNVTIPNFSSFKAFMIDCITHDSSTYPTASAFVYIPSNRDPHRAGYIHSGLIHTKITASGNKVTVSNIAGSAKINSIIGLKLYYNFSYNITREFYKVKFKLKHYLCSHLQKFI